MMTETPLLTIQTSLDGDVALVRCSGKLTSSVASELQSTVKPLVRSAKRVVIDLSDLTFMDSMGLGTVASLYVSAKTSGCALELINFSRRIRDLFSMTHLLSLFEPCGESNVTM
jgi:anti-sigma B factor antagonist